MRLLVIALVVLLSGCLQEPEPAELAVDYLATHVADADPATRAIIARAVVAHGEQLDAWPSPQAPLLDDLEVEPYAAALHGLIAARGQGWLDAVWAGHDGEQFGNPGSLADDMLAVHGLLLVGEPAADPRIEDAVQRIVAAQTPSGGWRFDGSAPGQVDETAWALASLQVAGALQPQAREAAVDFLIQARHESGLFVYGGEPNCQSTGWALLAWAMVDMEAPPGTRAALLECQNPDGGFALTPGGKSQPWVTADVLIGLAA